MLKISICIPQYNRIQFLLRSLRKLEKQTYSNIEIVISDDASTDSTSELINNFKPHYKYPITYHRFEKNKGYDRNLRKSLELATGQYCFILGNDDTLVDQNDLKTLAEFLEKNKFPEVGYCNFIDEVTPDIVQRRAHQTSILGSGPEVALKYHKSFSFVAGIIFKKTAFDSVNTDKTDGSIYSQIYLATRIIAEGGRLFTLSQPMVLKDIQVDGSRANSYRDKLIREWTEFRPVDSGLPQVAKVASEAFEDSGNKHTKYSSAILKKIYTQTYPFWLIDFRRNRAPIHAFALVRGLHPKVFGFLDLNGWTWIKMNGFYFLFTLVGLFTPIWFFNRLEAKIYSTLKK